MFVCFDFRCPNCGHTEERFVLRTDMDRQTHWCEDGGHYKMVRLPAGTRTHFKYHDRKLKR